MKTLKNILLIVVFLLPSQVVFSQWGPIYQLSSAGNVGYSDFAFPSPQIGWAAYVSFGTPSGDDYLAISKTNDFGLSWVTQTSLSESSLSVAKIVTSGFDTIYCFGSISFGGNCIYSYDAGNSWSNIFLGNYNYIADAFLLNRDTVFLTASATFTTGNKLLKFTPDSLYTLISTDSFRFYGSKIFFPGSKIGYIIAKDTLSNHILLSTTNGGDDWQTKFITSDYQFKDIFFISDSVGYICCSGGTILKTIDYGMNFTELTTSTINDLTDIQFLNDSCGYCIGENGTCIYTSDYGLTWTSDTINTTETLKKIQMFSMDHGYILSNLDFGYGFKLWSKGNLNNINFNPKDLIRTYPNPCSDLININLDSSSIINEISIYNTNGVRIYSNFENSREVDISDFDKGIYILILTIDNRNYVNKIIKQ